MFIGLGRGPPGRGGIEPGLGRGPPAPGPDGRPPDGRSPRGGRSPDGRSPRDGPDGRGEAGLAEPIPVLVELNGLLPGRGPVGRRSPPPCRGPGRGPGLGPRGPGLGPAGPGPVPGPGDETGPLGAPAAGLGRGLAGFGTAGPGLGAAGFGAAGRGAAGRAPAVPPAGPPSPVTEGLGATGLGAAALGDAAFFGAALDFSAGLAEADDEELENSCVSLRTTGASIVEDAERTNSPISRSLAITTLLSTPNSLASSYTRTFATALPTRSGGRPPDRRYLAVLIAACSSSAHSNLDLLPTRRRFHCQSHRPVLPYPPGGPWWPGWSPRPRPRDVLAACVYRAAPSGGMPGGTPDDALQAQGTPGQGADQHPDPAVALGCRGRRRPRPPPDAADRTWPRGPDSLRTCARGPHAHSS
jgi:hypothetical protein